MTQQTQTNLELVEPALPPPPAPRPRSMIFRFRRSERLLHWALAVPFVVLYASALAMALLWNEPQPRHARLVFSWIHRIAGVYLIVLPSIALYRGRGDWRTHLENIREAWIWGMGDIRWLLLAPRAALDRKVSLPDQGKFNAAEKLNFMMVCVASLVLIVTGILVWLPGVALFPWIAHCVTAVIGLPLVAGHIFMATVNPGTRAGLSGMITGWVDREWAKYHYGRWYTERCENEIKIVPFEHEPETAERALQDLDAEGAEVLRPSTDAPPPATRPEPEEAFVAAAPGPRS